MNFRSLRISRSSSASASERCAVLFIAHDPSASKLGAQSSILDISDDLIVLDDRSLVVIGGKQADSLPPSPRSMVRQRELEVRHDRIDAKMAPDAASEVFDAFGA